MYNNPMHPYLHKFMYITPTQPTYPYAHIHDPFESISQGRTWVMPDDMHLCIHTYTHIYIPINNRTHLGDAAQGELLHEIDLVGVLDVLILCSGLGVNVHEYSIGHIHNRGVYSTYIYVYTQIYISANINGP